MTGTFTRYLKYHSASTYMQIALISVLTTLFTLVIFSQEDPQSSNDIMGQILPVLSIAFAIIEFYPFLSKRNMDSVYSFPLGKVKTVLVHYLSGLQRLLITMGIVFFLWILNASGYPHYSLRFGLTVCYFMSLFNAAAIPYTFFSCIMLKARNIADATVMIGAWAALPMFVGNSLYRFIYIIERYFNNVNISISKFDWLVTDIDLIMPICFPKLVNVIFLDGFHNAAEFDGIVIPGRIIFDTEILVTIVIFALVAAGSLLLLTLSASGNRVETLGEPSRSWFGLKMLIPLYSICAMLYSYEVDPLTLLLILFATLGMYIFHRKSVCLKKSDYIVFAACAVFAFALEALHLKIF